MEDHMTHGTHLRALIRIAATAASIAVLSLAATHGARADDAAGAYYGSGCVQVVDAYGQVVTRC